MVKNLEDEDSVDLLLLFLSAGFDSSALATLWAIVHLTEHPEALKRAKVCVQSNIFSAFGFNLKSQFSPNYIVGSYILQNA